MMNYTNALLDRLKAKLELGSDYQLAKVLEVGASRISNYRNGRSVLDWNIAFKIADLLEEDDQKVVFGLLEDKYSNPRLINALQEGAPH
ncbi:transcriptional regulator [Vibrio vulnificus]|uniref:transcriptional regulator n=1 Tax=Vibrio vulnificus TaxID=672 RepID=UPI0009BB304A|nr:transcriptional regulator [Vibrio vulnificus]EHZ7358359.1 transcriptional regulator [Vibrio vulnificus]EJO2021520.1 transcriptional regulator [Vibrio vulnificus]EJV0371154.1 transcriptional regulator [Vibrio vulnificus]ELC9579313.1 transcriptional regulator [Vibrio vulnificus]ELG9630526.1 transcriptional regulator [Vibrio vulnificus]